MQKFLILFVALTVLSSCSGEQSSDNPTTPIVDDGNTGANIDDMMGAMEDEMPEDPLPSEPKPSPAPPAKTEATYQITFRSKWNERDHLGLPSNAHFSPIVLAVHREAYRLFPIGERANSAFERVAETGVARDLNSEIRGQIRSGDVLSSLNTDDMFLRSASSQTFKVTVTRDRPLISFVTMIAPSPDWVVGLDSLNMIEEGLFVESVKRDLFAYDGGTEEGDRGGNFSIRNSSTNPRERISRLRGRGLDEPFAEVEIELLGD